MLELKTECGGEEVGMGSFYEVFECAEKCRSISSMFIFGTNDHGLKKCDEYGCICFCETESTAVGTCNMENNMGFNLYRFNKPYAGKQCSQEFTIL